MNKRFKKYSVIGSIVLSLSVFSICKLYVNNVQANESKEIIYTVKAGDSLWSIASKHTDVLEDVNNIISRIRYANGINEVVYPGQKIIIPLN